MHRADGNPWSSPDPEAEWWRGETGAFPTIAGASPGAIGGGPDGSAEPVGSAPAAQAAKAAKAAKADGSTRATTTRRTKKAAGPASDPTDRPPTTEQPDAEQPDAEQPDAEQPDAEQPDADQPDAEQPDADPDPVDPARVPSARAEADAGGPLLPAAYGGEAAVARAAAVQDVSDAADNLDLIIDDADQDGSRDTREDDAHAATVRTPDAPTRATTAETENIAAVADRGDGRPATQPDQIDAHTAQVSTAGDDTAQVDKIENDRAEGGTARDDETAQDADDDRRDADGVPEVMVLPEHPRDRPTVVLARGTVPGQSTRNTSATPDPSRADATRADPTRADPTRADPTRADPTGAGIEPVGAGQVRVGQGRADPARLQAIEESSFWLAADEASRDGSAPGGGGPPASRLGVAPRPRDLPRRPRAPFGGLVGLLVLALAATFFAWVSAEPIWLAVGHGDRGTATVARCTGSGIAQRCEGTFTDGVFTSAGVVLLGVDATQRREGASVPARMVDRNSRQAFVGASGLLLHLRWSIGVLLVLLCGLCIAGTTGARRLESARARRRAVLLSIAGPLALLAGFLAVSY
jgi:hypothetical protein